MFDNIENQRAGDRKGRPYDVADCGRGFNVLTALKGWVGHAPQGRGALHHCFQVQVSSEITIIYQIFHFFHFFIAFWQYLCYIVFIG
jgi:hypothetical protein